MQENNNSVQGNKVEKEEAVVSMSAENSNTKNFNNMALTSFIFSLVGLIIAGIPCGIVALLLGGKELKQNNEKGKGFAIAGIIIGIIDIVLVIINIILKISVIAQ